MPNDRLGNLTGTSQSTAFVSSTAILKGLSPTISNLQLKKVILKSSKKINSLRGKCLTSGALSITNSINTLNELTKRDFASTK